MQMLARISVLAAAFPLFACQGDRTITLPLHRPLPDSPLAGIPTARVAVNGTVALDAALGGTIIGLGGETLGEVVLSDDPANTVAQLFAAELRSAGHLLAPLPEGAALDFTVETFEMTTTRHPIAEDVTLEISVVVEPTRSRYTGISQFRNDGYPRSLDLSLLAQRSLEQIASQFRRDRRVHDWLRGS